jgi:DNA-binding LacI/PurR family transcriptional regulator
MATTREIAEEAGVSNTTVSRVLNNNQKVNVELRERVLEAANRMRYVASAGKRDGMDLALVYVGDVSAGLLLNSPFDIGVLRGMSVKMQEYDYNLLIVDARRSKRSDETYTQFFHRKGIRGAILRTMSQSRGICEAIMSEGFPAVVVAERFESPIVNFVDSNSRKASFEGVSHLLEFGHRRIAFCMNDLEDNDHLDRYQSFVQAHEERGVKVNSNLVIRTPASRENGGKLLRRLMALVDRPTAVFIADPPLAMGAFAEATKLGIRIPEQLSILGVDDAEERFETVPNMAAVCQNTKQIGVVASEALIELIQDPDSVPIQHNLDAWLELHPSLGPPPS